MSSKVVIMDEDTECCICFMYTENKTPCGHLLCKQCWLQLSEPLCPICRQQISIIKMRRHVHGMASLSNEFAPDVDAGSPHLTEDRPALPALVSRPATAGVQRSRSMTSIQRPRLQALSSSRSFVLQARNTTASISSMYRRSSPDSPRSPLSPVSPPVLPSLPRSRRSRESDSMMSPSGSGVPRVGDLQVGINRLTLEDMPHFWHRVQGMVSQNLINASDGDALQKSLTKRMSTLIDMASLNAMSGILQVLDNFRDLQPGQDAASNPRRAYEVRFSWLVMRTASCGDRSQELEKLSKCHSISTELALSAWGLPQYQEIVINRIIEWIDVSPLSICCQCVGTLSALARAEPRVFEELAKRLKRQAQRKFQRGELQSLAGFLCGLTNGGLPIWSKDFEGALAQHLSDSITSWSKERLQDEIFGEGLVQLCQANETIGSVTRAAFSKRLAKNARAIASTLKSSSNLEEAKSALKDWTRYVQRAQRVDMLAFDQDMQRAILNGLSDCVEICMEPGSSLSGCLEEVQRMQWGLMLSVGGNSLSLRMASK